jgi:hypothetical protein
VNGPAAFLELDPTHVWTESVGPTLRGWALWCMVDHEDFL